ncbi:hypothetical protein ABL78_5982 [Leptomonas seymouri]|uniref:Uncharacterized protein n=1 Tax=Leptomonas seymouri TaxID=5684 RepID=A0A0N0P4L6_LEPSE|nr:hypothetical protein ABL78_5982 [Leptomonas seymouri]|eukprot:KPI84967.1 hypothetical protein ABL78_5982 [Leptomonas seymouri]
MNSDAEPQPSTQDARASGVGQEATAESSEALGASSAFNSPLPPQPPSPGATEELSSKASATREKEQLLNGSKSDVVQPEQPDMSPPRTTSTSSEHSEAAKAAAKGKSEASSSGIPAPSPLPLPADTAAVLAEPEAATRLAEPSKREADEKVSVAMAHATEVVARAHEDNPKSPVAGAAAAAAAAVGTDSQLRAQQIPQHSQHVTFHSPRVAHHHHHCHINNFDKRSDINCTNFFFHNEVTPTSGVGTVGLYAAKTAPLTAATMTANTFTSPLSGRRGFGATAAGGAEVAAHTGLNGDVNLHDPGMSAALRRYQSPIDHISSTFLPMINTAAWEEREEDYRQWKRRNLACSSYARLSTRAAMKTGRGPAATEESDRNEQNHDMAFAMTVPGPGGYLDLPVLWSKGQMKLEQRRLRALAAERATKAAVRAKSRRKHDARVLQHRSRKLKGEAMDMPDAYFRATYPDPTAPKGYIIPASAIHAGSESDDEDEVIPKQITKDHAKACQQHRVDMREQRLHNEACLQVEVEKQRQAMKKQLEERQADDEAFRASWMLDRPHISRSRENQRHSAEEAERRAAAQWNHSMRAQERGIYALYALEESAKTSARQKELRRRVLSRMRRHRGYQSNSSHSNPSSDGPDSRVPNRGRHDAKVGDGPSPPQNAGSPIAAPVARSPASPSQVTEVVAKGEREANDARPASAAPPSQLVGPTSTNFFNEVKLWTQEFSSPNTVPVNAADTLHRRLWKAELDEAQLRFNRDATLQQRELYPRRILEAREKAHEANWTQAEHERKIKKIFADKRADHAQADMQIAAALRSEIQEEAQRAQHQRRTQVEELHDRVQLQRQQSKQREEVLREFEAEEREYLRLIVSARANRA